jgi:hypothetical protein
MIKILKAKNLSKSTRSFRAEVSLTVDELADNLKDRYSRYRSALSDEEAAAAQDPTSVERSSRG